MRVDSLARLESMFSKWRSLKHRRGEAVPDDLLERARRAAAVHGVGPVFRATKVEYCRLKAVEHLAKVAGGGRTKTISRASHSDPEETKGIKRIKKVATRPVPAYSRIDFPTPEATARPLAEVETPAGVKLRVFAITPETVSLLSALSGPGRSS